MSQENIFLVNTGLDFPEIEIRKLETRKEERWNPDQEKKRILSKQGFPTLSTISTPDYSNPKILCILTLKPTYFYIKQLFYTKHKYKAKTTK